LGSSSITSTRTASSPAPSSSELHEGSIHLIEYTQFHRQPWLLHDDRKANAWFSPPPARCDPAGHRAAGGGAGGLWRQRNQLQSHGIEQTALHKHLLEQSPQVWWTHIHAMGEPAKLAAGVKAALDATAIAPAAAPPAQQPPVDLDTAGIDAALGRKGNPDGGLYKFNLARQDTIVDDGHLVPPTFGVTTTVNFQPLGESKAAIKR